MSRGIFSDLTLQPQEPFFYILAIGIAAWAVSGPHPVAGNEDGKGIGGHGLAHSACCARAFGKLSHLAVGHGLSPGYGPDHGIDPLLKIGAQGEVQIRLGAGAALFQIDGYLLCQAAGPLGGIRGEKDALNPIPLALYQKIYTQTRDGGAFSHPVHPLIISRKIFMRPSSMNFTSRLAVSRIAALDRPVR